MAMTQGTLQAGRIGLKKLFAVEMAKVDPEYLEVVGQRVDTTTQTAEAYKQYAGLGPSTQTPEGAKADFDDLTPIYTMYVKPNLYTKGIKFTVQTGYTDQYGVLKDLTPAFARAFVQRRNINVADLDNSGFTNTSYGQNSEALYSASHNMGGVYFSNRPLAAGSSPGPSATTLDIAFSPLGLEQMWVDLQNQKSARNTPQYVEGKINVKLPTSLYPQAARAVTSTFLAGTNNNDPNFLIKKYVNMPTVNHYYTSTTAWFAIADDPAFHGLFFLEQLPYVIEDLPRDEEILYKWVAYESWAFGWYDAHGTWGTLGA
jgi:hypothetical protein